MLDILLRYLFLSLRAGWRDLGLGHIVKHILHVAKSQEPTIVSTDWHFPKIDLMYFSDSLADITFNIGSLTRPIYDQGYNNQSYSKDEIWQDKSIDESYIKDEENEMVIRFQGKKIWLSLFYFLVSILIPPLLKNSNPITIIGQGTYSAFSYLHVRSDMILGSNSHPLLKTALVIWPPWLPMSPASLK